MEDERIRQLEDATAALVKSQTEMANAYADSHNEMVRQIEEANRALLDGHAKMAVAYRSQRQQQVEAEHRRLSTEVAELKAQVAALRSETQKMALSLRVATDTTNERLGGLDSRLDRGAKLFKELRNNGNGLGMNG